MFVGICFFGKFKISILLDNEKRARGIGLSIDLTPDFSPRSGAPQPQGKLSETRVSRLARLSRVGFVCRTMRI